MNWGQTMPRFSEPERFLLEQWRDARLLEEAMKGVRTKYAEIIDEVLERVRKSNRALDCPKAYFPGNGLYGTVAIGKSGWPKGSYAWPSGFWVDNLQLENLTSPEKEAPEKFVWISEQGADPKQAEGKLRKAAGRVLSKEELSQSECASDKNGSWLWWPFERRERLLKLLVNDEARGFVDCMVDHFGQMAKFTSAVDEILITGKRGRK